MRVSSLVISIHEISIAKEERKMKDIQTLKVDFELHCAQNLNILIKVRA